MRTLIYFRQHLEQHVSRHGPRQHSQPQSVMDNSEDFSALPLWYAHWDKEANFDDWSDLPFGGWESENLRGKQYQGDTYIEGADPIVDLNHMRIPEERPDALADGSGETMDQTTMKAMLQSIVAGPVAGV